MSFFFKIVQWFVLSPELSGARAEAVKAITEAGKALVKATQKHAPDMVGAVEQDVTNAVTKAVAGALTKAS